MSNEVAHAPNHLPGVAGLAAGLRRTQAAMPSSSRLDYLNFGKDGRWTVGREREECTGDHVILNIQTLKAGYVCWTDYAPALKKKNEKLGEVMHLSATTPVDPSSLPDHGWPWKSQQSIDGRFQSGDQGEFAYSASSLGGLDAFDVIVTAVLNRIAAGEEAYLYPVVELATSYYNHPQWGQTYTPDIKIVAWADMEGDVQGAEAPKKVTKKVTKKRAEPPADKQAEEPAEEPEETAPDEEQSTSDEADQAGEDAPPVRRRRR